MNMHIFYEYIWIPVYLTDGGRLPKSRRQRLYQRGGEV